jgi:hypothetical protein
VIVRIGNWLVLLISVVAFQGILADHLAPNGLGLRWNLLIIVLAGYTGGMTRGIIAGALVGFLSDCLMPDFLGWGIITKTTLGAGIGFAYDRFFMERTFARWALFVVGILAHDLVYQLPITQFNFATWFNLLLTNSSISALITASAGTLLIAYWEHQRTHKGAASEQAAAREG